MEPKARWKCIVIKLQCMNFNCKGLCLCKQKKMFLSLLQNMHSCNRFWGKKSLKQFSLSTTLYCVVIQTHAEFEDKQYSFYITHNQICYMFTCNISLYLQSK